MQDCKTNLLQFSTFLCLCDSGKCGLFPILPLARWRRRRQPPPIANGFDMMPEKGGQQNFVAACARSSPQLVVSDPLRRTGLPADSPKPTSQHQKYLPVKATNQLPKNIDKHKPQRVAILSSVSWCPLVLTEGPSGSFVSAAFVCPFLRFAANVRISSVVKFNVRKECIGLGFWSAFQLQSSPSRWMPTLWGHSFAWGCVRLTYCTKHLAAPGHLPLLHHGLALGGRRINGKV